MLVKCFCVVLWKIYVFQNPNEYYLFNFLFWEMGFKLTSIFKPKTLGLKIFFQRQFWYFFFCTCLNKSHSQMICASSITSYMLQTALKWDSEKIQPPGNSQLVKLLHLSPHIFNYIALIQSSLISPWFINAVPFKTIIITENMCIWVFYYK